MVRINESFFNFLTTTLKKFKACFGVNVMYWYVYLGWNKASDTLVPATLFDLLKYHLSLRKGLSSSFLGALSGYASDPKEKALLLKISKSDEEYKKWKADEFGIIDIMKRMTSLKVDSSVLCFHLKPLLPR